jgi:hypothetical protein
VFNGMGSMSVGEVGAVDMRDDGAGYGAALSLRRSRAAPFSPPEVEVRMRWLYLRGMVSVSCPR